MSKMVKVLFEERKTRLQGESSNANFAWRRQDSHRFRCKIVTCFNYPMTLWPEKHDHMGPCDQALGLTAHPHQLSRLTVEPRFQLLHKTQGWPPKSLRPSLWLPLLAPIVLCDLTCPRAGLNLSPHDCHTNP